MLDYAINNEMTGSVNFPPFLTTNPSIEEMNIMTESTLTQIDIKCKAEKAAYDKRYRELNREKIAIRKHECYEANREAVLIRSKKRYETNTIEINARNKKWQQDNPDKIAVINKRYYESHLEKMVTKCKKYYEANRDKLLAINKEYRENNPIKEAERKRLYNQTPIGKATSRKRSQERRALKATVDYEDFNPNEVLERDGYRCQLCGKKTRPDYNPYHPLYPHLDHIVPLSLGGPHTKVNTQCLCRLCNLQKHNTGRGDQLRIF